MASSEASPWLNASYTPDPNAKRGEYTVHMDISGGDLSRGPLPATGTHLDCEKRCNVTAGCEAYVFAPAGCAPEKLPAPMCYLKTDVTSASPNPCRNYRVMGPSKDKSTVRQRPASLRTRGAARGRSARGRVTPVHLAGLFQYGGVVCLSK